MKKLLAVSLVAFLSMPSFAAVGERAPKPHIDINYTLNWSTACAGPGALYSIMLGTGNATADFAVCKDTNPTVNTMTASNPTSATLGPRIYYSSSTAVLGPGLPSNGNTNFVFDPPLYFFNGMQCAVNSASDQATVVFECGRGLSGY